jgi:hypothetical protein
MTPGPRPEETKLALQEAAEDYALEACSIRGDAKARFNVKADFLSGASYQRKQDEKRIAELEEERELLRNIAVVARDAMNCIHTQKTIWPAEVDNLDDALSAWERWKKSER